MLILLNSVPSEALLPVTLQEHLPETQHQQLILSALISGFGERTN